jgi:hypothetical protein
MPFTNAHKFISDHPGQEPRRVTVTNLKAYAALVGAVCSALLGVFAADTTIGKVLTALSVVATAVVTWAAPWAVEDKPTDDHDGYDWERGRADVLYVLAVVLVVLVILALVGVI